MTGRRFKATKLTLYREVPRILAEMRIPGQFVVDEKTGAQDIVYRIFCDEAIRMMAAKLGAEPERVFDALDSVMHASLDELGRYAQPDGEDE